MPVSPNLIPGARVELEDAKQNREGVELSPAAQELLEAEGAARFARHHRGLAPHPHWPFPPHNLHVVARAAERLVAEAASAGLVLTIEQRPLQPLAMGHYETVVSVRPARGRA